TCGAWASCVSLRPCARPPPRQSLSSLILASISREGESPSSFELLFFFTVVVAFFMVCLPSGNQDLRLPRLGALICQHRAQLERLERRLVGLLVEGLAQAGGVRVLLVGDLDGLALGGGGVVGLRHVHGAHLAQRVLGGA